MVAGHRGTLATGKPTFPLKMQAKVSANMLRQWLMTDGDLPLGEQDLQGKLKEHIRRVSTDMLQR